MQVELVSPDRAVWSGQAEFVIARTAEGEIGILPGHQPLLGTLVECVVTIRPVDGGEVLAAVHGGFLSVSAEGVSILAEVVELADEVDVGRAREALQRTQGAGPDDEEGRAAHRRAEARLRATGQQV